MMNWLALKNRLLTSAPTGSHDVTMNHSEHSSRRALQ